MSLYSELVEAGVTVDNHQSDLYFEKNPISDKIAAPYRDRLTITTFTDSKTGGTWYCAYFMYEPFWDKKKQVA